MSRASLVTLVICLALGLGAGLYIGWVAAPVQYVDTGPASLSQTYKDDYVLMIAAIYSGNGDLAAARARLAALGFDDPGPAVAAGGRRALGEGRHRPGRIGFPQHGEARAGALNIPVYRKTLGHQLNVVSPVIGVKRGRVGIRVLGGADAPRIQKARAQSERESHDGEQEVFHGR